MVLLPPLQIDIDEDDVAVLGYTGGTTGKPKGVMTTHRNIITSCYNTVLERGISPNDIFLDVPPVFHAGGANSMFAFAFLGATNVFLNTSSIDLILKAVEEHRITNFVLVPTVIMSLLENPNIGRYDLESLKEIYYGTAPISVEPLRRLMKLMNCKLSQTYGMTETFVPISILKAEDHVCMGEAAVQRLSSAGRPVMGVKVKIVDDRGNEVETGRVGEVTVQGKNVMKGYWKQPELTLDVLKDGWLFTGDVGYMDELGYLFIVDRKKDMIISGGENIYSKEVEDVLSSHPDVANAVVIGVPDEKWGEAVKALVVKKKGAELTEKELIDFCKESLAGYKKPKSVEFMQDFPKSCCGEDPETRAQAEVLAGSGEKDLGSGLEIILTLLQIGRAVHVYRWCFFPRLFLGRANACLVVCSFSYLTELTDEKGGIGMRKKSNVTLTAIVLTLFCLLWVVPYSASSDFPSIVGIATIGVGTSSHTSTVAYAPLLEKELGVPVRAMPSDSTKVSFSQMREKRALYAALSTSSLGVALQGERPYDVKGWGPQKITLLWMGYDGPFGFVVRKDSPIQSIKDLKGKDSSVYGFSRMDGRCRRIA